MNLTMELLQLLGSPFAPAITSIVDQDELIRLCHYSSKNRMLLLYLETIDLRKLGNFSAAYQEENIRFSKTDDTIVKASKVLTDARIEHAVFKTFRPYKSTTVDIDILILGHGNYTKSVKVMRKAGYELVGYGPRSTTLRDRETNIGIDLYEQVAVSFITYIDKEKIINYVTTTRLPNGEYVKTLEPEADLATLIAHSVVKEQMYMLSEYFTFIYYLKKMNIPNFLRIVKQNNITFATRTHASITALLHKAAHNTVPNKLHLIVNQLGEETFEKALLIKNDFKTPHRYHPITIARSLLEISKGEKSRRSMAMQIRHMLNPKFTKKFAIELIDHVIRETY